MALNPDFIAFVTSSVSRLMTFPSLAPPFARSLARISPLFAGTSLRFPSWFRAANFFLAHVVLPEAGRPRRKYAVFKTTSRRPLVSPLSHHFGKPGPRNPPPLLAVVLLPGQRTTSDNHGADLPPILPWFLGENLKLQRRSGLREIENLNRRFDGVLSLSLPHRPFSFCLNSRRKRSSLAPCTLHRNAGTPHRTSDRKDPSSTPLADRPGSPE